MEYFRSNFKIKRNLSIMKIEVFSRRVEERI